MLLVRLLFVSYVKYMRHDNYDNYSRSGSLVLFGLQGQQLRLCVALRCAICNSLDGLSIAMYSIVFTLVQVFSGR